MPESATKQRRISLVPSKMRLMRASRRHALVRVVLHVADAGGDLQRLVDHAPQRLRAVHFADRALERVVGDLAVDEAGGEVGHRLEREGLGHHRGDLVLDEAELADGAAERLALLHALDGHLDERACTRRRSPRRARGARCSAPPSRP